ncbi:sphingomyelin phosphodiesterase 4 [Culicoides brevitarsis]|uniref:sphingomyelin phosphodiesterase 4 n=1 Tax=Culicoides brevitarsis TaxID=469753 RepID=UPI00307B43E2
MIENMSIRILDILNLPLMHRCPELGLIIDRASLKELQEIFPVLINSIFGLPGGSVGWGLRTTQQTVNHQEFEILYNFFIPLGPMFRLLYRLLSDPIKFDVPIGFLPPKMQQMLESGRYPGFYSDIITIDPFRRQIVSLALNAFDFFFIHFVTHGTLPLHKMYPTAAQLNSEKARTVYFYLAADYLCTFLPSKPDTIIQPQNIGTIKLPTVAPVPNIQPIKRPKYLLLSAISNHTAPQQQTCVSPRHHDSPRANIWRSETVLYLFVDAWLRSDFDEHRDLPSNEFVRLVRVLVKQLHAFGNSADQDNTALQGLRQTAAPLMNSKMYLFIKSLISRWPLDSSFADVLELWLSFIQPWRYVHNRDLNVIAEMPVPARFEPFIAENLVVFTQIFVKLVPRFERIDLSTYKNVFMLFRVLKVFGQSNLADILRRCESSVGTNVINANYIEAAVLQSNSFNKSGGDRSPNRSGEWRPYSRNETLDESYVPLFTGDFIYKLEELTRKILVVKHIARSNLKEVEEEYEKKHRGILGFLRSIFSFEEDTALTQIITDRRKIPEILDFCGQSMRGVFEVNVPEPSMTEEFMDEFDSVRRSSEGFNQSDKNMSEFSDHNFSITPSFMKNNSKTLKYGGDPALLPIGDAEVTFLVRFLHQLSCKLNLMFPHEINKNWHRNDLLGRITRQLLLPPMVSQTFDKSTGLCILKREDLPPRICLRPLASFKTLTFVTISQLLSYLLWGAPSYGLFLLMFFAFMVVFVRALFTDVPLTHET